MNRRFPFSLKGLKVKDFMVSAKSLFLSVSPMEGLPIAVLTGSKGKSPHRNA